MALRRQSCTTSAGSASVIVALLSIVSFFDATTAFTPVTVECRVAGHSSLFMAGGWGNNQERGVLNEEIGGINGAPIYDAYEIEDRGSFMNRVKDERKVMRRKKAADLLEVARIAGVELKKKENDPEKLDLFDPEDMTGTDEYLDVSI